ncbi:hypothetical protein BDW22DRAFT_699633 [Trametopsis cervina]|nr:hypothetical protein BDW22DRAFT_699633 [Trametopsis cervina]
MLARDGSDGREWGRRGRRAEGSSVKKRRVASDGAVESTPSVQGKDVPERGRRTHANAFDGRTRVNAFDGRIRWTGPRVWAAPPISQRAIEASGLLHGCEGLSGAEDTTSVRVSLHHRTRNARVRLSSRLDCTVTVTGTALRCNLPLSVTVISRFRFCILFLLAESEPDPHPLPHPEQSQSQSAHKQTRLRVHVHVSCHPSQHSTARHGENVFWTLHAHRTARQMT